MDSRPIDQHLSPASCHAGENQGPTPAFAQHTAEKAPALPCPQIRDWDAGVSRADTDCHDTHRVPSDQAATQLIEDCHAHEPDSNISGPTPCSTRRPQHITTELAHRTPSPTPSVHTRSDHSDISATVTSTLSDPTLVSSNSTLQCPPALQITESLGLEGCAGIIGGFIGILGIIGFLTFLWFGGKIH